MMISDLDERITRFKSTHHAHFIDSACIDSFEPYDIGNALSNSNWVIAMHEELKIFERN